MNNTRRFCATAFLLLLFVAPPCLADGVLVSWSPNEVPGVTKDVFEAAKKMPASAIIERNLEVASWTDAFLLMVAARQHRDDSAFKAALAAQLTNHTQVPLQGTRRLIVWERITTGEILFEGKGYHTPDDLFSVAGRANWMLRSMTSKTFGHVRPASSETDLRKLQGDWSAFLAGQDVEAYRPAIAPDGGLDELKSLEALEALIVSLRPSEEKDQVTRECLRSIYGIEELPKDPENPAVFCNPDSFTHGYLAILTGEKKSRDHGWWGKWWTEHREALTWDAKKQVFVAGVR